MNYDADYETAQIILKKAEFILNRIRTLELAGKNLNEIPVQEIESYQRELRDCLYLSTDLKDSERKNTLINAINRADALLRMFLDLKDKYDDFLKKKS